MEISDIFSYARSDAFYLELIGAFIRQTRIEQQQTQMQLAEAAGVNRTTLVNLEKGKAANLLSFIQVLRALKRLDVLQALEIQPKISPLRVAEMEQSQPRRVRATTAGKATGKPKSDW